MFLKGFLVVIWHKKWRLFSGFIVLILLIFGSALAGLQGLKWYLKQPLDLAKTDRHFTLERGESLYHGVRYLEQTSSVRFPFLIVIYARSQGLTQVKAGEYEFTGDETLISWLDTLNQGQVKQYSLTFVEGSTFSEWLIQLRQTPTLKKQLANLNQHQIHQNLEIIQQIAPNLIAQTQDTTDAVNFEGRFFPDTYYFTAAHTDIDILAPCLFYNGATGLQRLGQIGHRICLIKPHMKP